MKKLILVLTILLASTQWLYADKIIDLDTKLIDFNGKPVMASEKEDGTLKSALIFYLTNANQMSLSNEERFLAYEIGVLVGKSSGKLKLEQKMYDLVKKICDSPVVQDQRTRESVPISSVVVTAQVKKLIDSAENLEEVK